MIDTLFHYPSCPLSSKLHCFYIPLFMSSHFCFMSFIKGHKIRHIYYCLSRYPHSAQDNRLLTHTALFPEGLFCTHTCVQRSCVKPAVAAGYLHPAITDTAGLLYLHLCWSLCILEQNGLLSLRWMVINLKEQTFSDILKDFFFFSFLTLKFMWPLYFEGQRKRWRTWFMVFKKTN